MVRKHDTHLNDKTMKYKTMAQTRRQHEYLGLPGEFKIRYPQEVVFPDMDSGRMDELYLNNEDIMINLEEESDSIDTQTDQKINKYNKFIRYIYNKEVYHAAICHKDPKKEFECYKAGPSNYIKIHLIYISQNILWERYENVISKVEQKEELSEMEALDMAFVSKFIDPQYKKFVIDSLTKSFNSAIIHDKKLKMDVAIILNAMITKNYSSKAKQDELRERINMREYESEMEKIIYEEFGEELSEKDRELETQKQEHEKTKQEHEKTKQELKTQKQKTEKLNKTNKEYKNKIEKLNQMKDLNTPEARNILNSLILL